MRKAITAILIAFIAQTLSNRLGGYTTATSDVHDSTDELVGCVVRNLLATMFENLFDRVLMAPFVHYKDCDRSAQGNRGHVAIAPRSGVKPILHQFKCTMQQTFEHKANFKAVRRHRTGCMFAEGSDADGRGKNTHLLLMRAPGNGAKLFELELFVLAKSLGIQPAQVVERACGVWQLLTDDLRLYSRVLDAGLAGLRSGLDVLVGPASSPEELLQEAAIKGPFASAIALSHNKNVWLTYEQHYLSAKEEDVLLPFFQHQEAPMLLVRLLPLLQVPLATSALEAELELVLIQVQRMRNITDNLKLNYGVGGGDVSGRVQEAYKTNEHSSGRTWLLAAKQKTSRQAWSNAWASRPHSRFDASLDPFLAAAATKITLTIHRLRTQLDLRERPVKVVNPCQGHGTITAAAAADPSVELVFGSDVRRDCVEQSRQNLKHVGVEDGRVDLFEHDATSAFPPRVLAANVSVVLAAPPWGMNTGEGKENVGTEIMRSVITQFPQATYGFLAHRKSIEDLENEGLLRVLETASVRKKIDFVVGIHAGLELVPSLNASTRVAN